PPGICSSAPSSTFPTSGRDNTIRPPVRRQTLTAVLTREALAAWCVLALSCCAGGPSENVLAGKPPARADGVARPDLITDGTLAAEGAPWDASAATPFSS